MKIEDVLKKIREEGNKIFTIKFIKRTTGEERTMQCRTGVKKHLKGGEAAYKPGDHGLIWVYSMDAKGYRSIPIEGILEFNGEKVKYPAELSKEKKSKKIDG